MRFTTVLVAISAATSGFALPLSFTGGDATYYNTGLGSCGISSTDSELVVAVDAQTIQSFPGAGTNPNLNPMCGRQLQVTYQTKSVIVKVVDTCPAASCAVGCLDLALLRSSSLRRSRSAACTASAGPCSKPEAGRQRGARQRSRGKAA